MPPLKTKRGRLTIHGLACGYIERYEHGEYSVQLWHEGGPNYHVRLHSTYQGRIYWATMTSLVEARRLYDQTKRIMKEGLVSYFLKDV